MNIQKRKNVRKQWICIKFSHDNHSFSCDLLKQSTEWTELSLWGPTAGPSGFEWNCRIIFTSQVLCIFSSFFNRGSLVSAGRRRKLGRCDIWHLSRNATCLLPPSSRRPGLSSLSPPSPTPVDPVCSVPYMWPRQVTCLCRMTCCDRAEAGTFNCERLGHRGSRV